MYMIGRELQESFEIQKQQGSEIALELKDVHVAKGEKAILDHVNMTVRKGRGSGDCRCGRQWTDRAGGGHCGYPENHFRGHLFYERKYSKGFSETAF